MSEQTEAQVTHVFHRYTDPNPTHAVNTDSVGNQLAWCGSRLQYRHRLRPGTRDEVTCTRCKAALAANQPRAWRSR